MLPNRPQSMQNARWLSYQLSRTLIPTCWSNRLSTAPTDSWTSVRLLVFLKWLCDLLHKPDHLLLPVTGLECFSCFLLPSHPSSNPILSKSCLLPNLTTFPYLFYHLPGSFCACAISKATYLALLNPASLFPHHLKMLLTNESQFVSLCCPDPWIAPIPPRMKTNVHSMAHNALHYLPSDPMFLHSP